MSGPTVILSEAKNLAFAASIKHFISFIAVNISFC